MATDVVGDGDGAGDGAGASDGDGDGDGRDGRQSSTAASLT